MHTKRGTEYCFKLVKSETIEQIFLSRTVDYLSLCGIMSFVNMLLYIWHHNSFTFNEFRAFKNL